MDTDSKKKQVSYDQLTSLLDFLKEHQELAKGLVRGHRGKFQTLKIWNLCAKKMNVKDGAIKDGKGWAKYWCDWKYRARRRALELKAAKDNNRPSPEGVTPLSPMEQTILSIIGENAVDSVVIKNDPLAEGDSEEQGEDNNSYNDDDITQYYSAPSRPSRHKRHRSKDHGVDLDDYGGPSSPLEKKHKKADKNGHFDDSDHDDEASEFLRLEREKLENSKHMVDSLQTINSEITRLADVMTDIRDILASNKINL